MESLVLSTDDVLAAIQRYDGVRLAKRTLAQWAQAGVVVPSIAWRKVRRAPRLYSYADLGRARLVVRLTRQLGMSLQVARQVLGSLDAAETPLHELLRPANVRQARTMEAVFVVRAGTWRAVMVKAGDADYTMSGDRQARLQFGPVDEFRIPLADVVKDYRRIERDRAMGAA
jgi:DNA-binding transcriptional MerR regulator